MLLLSQFSILTFKFNILNSSSYNKDYPFLQKLSSFLEDVLSGGKALDGTVSTDLTKVG